MKPTFLAAMIAAGIASTPSFARQCPPENERDDEISERGIVHVRPGATIEDFLADLAIQSPDVGVTIVDQIPGRPIYLLGFEIPTGQDEDEFEIELDEDFRSTLISGEFVYEAEAPEGKTGSTWVDGLGQDQYEQQFALGVIDTPAAHERSTGRGTVVAVLDSGVDASHPALAGRVLPSGYDFVDDDDDPSDIGDGINNDPHEDELIDEMTGHGTFVAGLIAMVAPDAKILPIRVLDSDGGGNSWSLTQALFYAIDHGVEVINLSVGTTSDIGPVKQAALEAAARGIVIVAAAGNFDCEEVREFPAMDRIRGDEDDEDPETYPALDLVGAFGVAATGPDDVKAGFSNYHEDIVISAPGAHDDPLDPGLPMVSALPEGRYGAWEGTSFATPTVAGTIALLRAQHPELSPGDWRPEDYASGDWTPDFGIYTLMHTRITTTAFNHYSLNDGTYGGPDCPGTRTADCLLGAGRLDAAAATAASPLAPALGDLNADGAVDFADFVLLLGDWGRIHSSADLDGDGRVTVGDIIVLLHSWG